MVIIKFNVVFVLGEERLEHLEAPVLCVGDLGILVHIVEIVMARAKLFLFVLNVIFINIWYLVKTVLEQDM